MYDLPSAVLALLICFLLFFATARVIGWALGISLLRKRIEDLIVLQKEIAKKQGIKFHDDEFKY